MSTPTVLNNVDHKDLKVDTRPSAFTGYQVNRTRIYASEVSELHKEFPLVFHKDSESGDIQIHAILGLSKDENLFLDDNGWITRYVPALLGRGPFSIAYRESDDAAPQPFICVDTDDPRINETEGEPVFMPMGGESGYLSYVKRALQTIEAGTQYNKTLFALVEEMELLEHVNIEVKLSNVEQVNFSNYYTINQDKLSQLSGEALARLSQFGMLGPLYFIVSSLANFQRLIDLKNAKSSLL
ncbi:SapC family protein [Alteromonas confluentis]|uniref:Peptide ABC transporter permease n=1 Tax=Alteromonas confluentis TaxID=1656094 RepID=A0A1E7Z6N6_9ALTE|nr:SapC family protein [Alteromonas confluentis]OFC69170.1 peptide ABC transporter permease [Alteromonas confluentis]